MFAVHGTFVGTRKLHLFPINKLKTKI